MTADVIHSLALDIRLTLDRYADLLNKEAPRGTPREVLGVKFREVDLLDGLEEEVNKWIEEGQTQEDGANITMNQNAFWAQLIRAKLEVICLCGGDKLMQEVYSELGAFGLNGRFSYSGMFASLATGICSWHN